MADYILLVGISEYADRYMSNLRLAHRDAQNLYGLFRHGLGFGDNAILLPPDVSLRDFNRQFNAIGQKIKSGDRLIVYFSGHGYQHGDEQYLLLADAEKAEIEAGRLTMQEVISLKTLKARVESWPNVQCLFILDTCRRPLSAAQHRGADIPYEGNALLGRMFARDPACGAALDVADSKQPPSRTLVLNACSDGDYAWEPEDGDASVLVKAFESAWGEALKRGEAIRIDRHAPAKLRDQIRRLWGKEHPQSPWLSPADGVFELRSANQPKTSPPDREALHAQAIDDDETEWAIATADNSIEAYKAYALRKPSGKYKNEAIRLISKHSLPPNAKPTPKKRLYFLWGGVALVVFISIAANIDFDHPSSTSSTELKNGSTVKDCDICPEMVIIPAGKYEMGSNFNGASKTESPARTVNIPRQFLIGKTEITATQYNECVKDKQCKPIRMNKGEDLGNGVYMPYAPTHPVLIEKDQITERTSSYLIWLSSKTGKGYRLPSASEWEYAARAGTSTNYYWGTSDEKICDYENVRDLSSTPYNRTSIANDGNIANCSDGYPGTAPVASFKPNPWGLYDTLGNVAEVVADCWSDNALDYPSNGTPLLVSEQSEKEFDTTCSKNRLVKGGSYAYSYSPEKHYVWRQKLASKRRGEGLGFRIARDP